MQGPLGVRRLAHPFFALSAAFARGPYRRFQWQRV